MLMMSMALAFAARLSAKMMGCCVLPDEWLMDFLFLADLFPFLGHTSPLSSCFLFLSPPSLCVCVCVRAVLKMFISYQVIFIHISCLITDPADNSFENLIYEDMKV